MNTELAILKDLASRLERAAIPYMLTGSVAANFYAVPRMTRDIDVVAQILPKDIGKVYDLFKEDYYIDKDSIIEAVEKKHGFNIIHNEQVFKVDFMIRKDTPYRRLEFDRRRVFDLQGQKISIVSGEDLIISKLDWAKDSQSEMQLNDVRNLTANIKELDQIYLKKWISSLGLEAIYQKVMP